MRLRWTLLLAAAAAALAALAPDAAAQELSFRYRSQAGRIRAYEGIVRTETTMKSADKTVRTVREVPLKREDYVVETKAQPPSMRVVTLETPVGERLTAYDEDGQSRLDTIPEANRLRPLPALLSAQWRDLTGRPEDKPAASDSVTGALDQLQAEMRLLPDKPLKPGDTVSREVDLGVFKAVLTTRFVEQKAVGSVPAAILETRAAITMPADKADRITIDRLECRTAWATDGSGWISLAILMTLTEKSDQAEQRLDRRYEEKLLEQTDADAAALAAARKELEQLEHAMAQARTSDLDGALQTLDTFLSDSASSRWAAAVQTMRAGLSRRRLMTQEVPKPRLRLMLRDLQTARDQAGARGAAAEVAQVDQTIRQVATVNAKAILEDAIEPDPILRDLAAFGLAFLDEPQAAARLKAMAKDASGQVRGTAVVGLAIRGDAVDVASMTSLLTNDDERTRGAAALLLVRTVKRDDPQAAATLPLLIANLGLKNAWARLNSMATLAAMAPKESPEAARAILEACKAEPEDRLKPAYIEALKTVTGVEAAEIGPFEEWVKKHPAAAPAAAP
ncbi:MAG: HEAT repeat domain-containing protein, partial [Planctomycetes bacterium]|nr:HEAT repeat domain-containing protein [Planctomycetota bacterium]